MDEANIEQAVMQRVGHLIAVGAMYAVKCGCLTPARASRACDACLAFYAASGLPGYTLGNLQQSLGEARVAQMQQHMLRRHHPLGSDCRECGLRASEYLQALERTVHEMSEWVRFVPPGQAETGQVAD